MSKEELEDDYWTMRENDAYRLRIKLAGADETISQLKQQLAEMTEKYNACQEARKFEIEDKKQSLKERTDIIIKLEKQLAEKEKEIEINKNALKKLIKNCNTVKCENKIAFAVEQLNLLYKTLTTEDVWRAMRKGWWLNNGECLQLRQTIDNQIKQLKEGK